MDARHFDTLTRVLSSPAPRRRLLALLATIPLLGYLLGWLDPEDGAAKDRRRRRKGRHKQKQSNAKGKRKRKQHKRACKPKSKATACAGQCGEITSRLTCGKTVDCGSCACPTPCGECFTCQAGPNTPGACVPDPDQVGDPCGSAGQVCASDGSCACTATSCAACEECGGDGVCTGCSGCCDGDTCVAACPACTLCDASQGQCLPCPGCCDASGVCQNGDTNAACGVPGGECDICTAPETCGGGDDAGVCGCTPITCAEEGKDCGQIDDGCGATLDCGSCGGDTPICISNVCTACTSDGQCGDDAVCCGGACFSGVCCGNADCDDPTAPDCQQHACTCVSNGDAPCSGGTACCAAGCVNLKTDLANCGECGNDCPANNLCVAGVCTACTVTCSAADHTCDGAAVQTALAGGGTVVVCPGLYTGSIAVADINAVTLIGAGDGDDPAANTLFRYLSVSNVTTFAMSRVQVRGFADGGTCPPISGIAISGSGATLTGCTIAKIGPKGCNTRSSFTSSTVEMVKCLVTGSYRYTYGGLLVDGGKLTTRGTTFYRNYTLGDGGGLHVTSGAEVKLLDGTVVNDNRADEEGGGIYAVAGTTVTISEDSSVTANRNASNQPISNCAGGGTFDGTCGP